MTIIHITMISIAIKTLCNVGLVHNKTGKPRMQIVKIGTKKWLLKTCGEIIPETTTPIMKPAIIPTIIFSSLLIYDILASFL